MAGDPNTVHPAKESAEWKFKLHDRDIFVGVLKIESRAGVD